MCDFGLGRIRQEVTRTQTTIRVGGRARFLAPELLDGTEEFRTSEASDVYSLSMVILSAWAHERPFVDYPTEKAAGAAARRGQRPLKPLKHVLKGVPLNPATMELLWRLLEEMWAQDPRKRPSVQVVEASVDALFGGFPLS